MLTYICSYMMKMSVMNFLNIKRIIFDLVAAICVLALMFLSFAYSPANASQISQYLYLTNSNAQVVCGNSPDETEHKTSWRCEACRLASLIDIPSISNDCFAGSAFIFVKDLSIISLFVQFEAINKTSYARAPPFNI